MPDITTTDLWNLHASTSAIGTAAGKWRELQSAATSVKDIIDAAAGSVVAEDSWTGAPADRYDDHRRKLTNDIEDAAELAGDVAAALDRILWTLAGAQNQLAEARESLNVAATASGDRITFHPADDTQTAAVNAAINAANLIRAGVDEQLVLEESAFRRATSDIVDIKDSWRERTIRVANLNIGSGHDNNTLSDKQGVSPEEVDNLAERLAGQNPDIVTVQEVFEEDLGTLERELEERTGDEWNYHFTHAADKARITDVGSVLDILGGDPGGTLSEPFGNAILVREGEHIEGSETVDDDIHMSQEGDGEGRSGLQVEVDLRPTND